MANIYVVTTREGGGGGVRRDGALSVRSGVETSTSGTIAQHSTTWAKQVVVYFFEIFLTISIETELDVLV